MQIQFSVLKTNVVNAVNISLFTFISEMEFFPQGENAP